MYLAQGRNIMAEGAVEHSRLVRGGQKQSGKEEMERKGPGTPSLHLLDPLEHTQKGIPSVSHADPNISEVDTPP